MRRSLSILAIAVAPLVACTGAQNFMHPAGPAARGLASLGWLSWVVLSGVTVVVWILIAWIALRRRGSLLEHAPIDVNQGQSWILIGGLAIPVVVLTILFVAAIQTMAAYPIACGDTRARSELCVAGLPQIRVTGQQWWFNAEYLFDAPSQNFAAPTEIHIPVGRPIDIDLVTHDVIHSFWIPRLHGKVDMIPGQVNRIRIQADQPGIYQGECAEYCGVQHAHMRLQIVAQPASEFQAWLAAQRAPATAPASEEARAGREAFERGSCVVCHTVRGTSARGQVGPELTHVASRSFLAGGMLENRTANLEAWVTHAQAFKPGVVMPDLTEFTGVQLRALVAYLQTLK